jgi:predicted double-glycine peptidase
MGMTQMKPADTMMNGDMVRYITPKGSYTVDLYRHPGSVGHVTVTNNLSNTREQHASEEFGAAQERARSLSLFLKMVERSSLGL